MYVLTRRFQLPTLVPRGSVYSRRLRNDVLSGTGETGNLIVDPSVLPSPPC